MIVNLNGSTVELPDRANVAAAITAAGVENAGRGVAVAVDGEVVPRAEWAKRALREGESVEVVRAVQGG